MKILFVSTDFPFKSEKGTINQGGGGACIAQLAEGLFKKGFDIEVVTRQEAESCSELYDFPVHRTGYYNLGFRESKITHALSATRKCKEILSKNKFDIIHTHNPTAGLSGCMMSNKFKLPHVMTLHGPWASVRQKSYTKAIARLIESKTVRCADMVTCDSIALQDEMISSYGIPTEKTIAIWNAIDSVTFSPKISKAAARKKMGLETDKPIILYTGRFVEEKGVHYLLEAFESISDSLLLLVGGGADEHLIDEWLSKNPEKRDEVMVIPYLPYAMMPAVYNACDIFVLPTLAEGFSRSIMEAMASEKPIVATDAGGNKEEIADGRGILVPPRDPKALSLALKKLLDKPTLRAQMGKKGREFAVNDLAVEKRIDKFIEVYQNLI